MSGINKIAVTRGFVRCGALTIAVASFLGAGTLSPQIAQADTTAAGAEIANPLSPAAVTSIQSQLQAAINAVNAKGLTGAALDAALTSAVAQVMIEDAQMYGTGSAGEIASVILASTTIPPTDIGAALGQAAAELAATNFNPGKATAQAVANEGAPATVEACANAADRAGNHNIAEICEGQPVITGATNAGLGGSVAANTGGGGGVAPPPPPPACTSPSCS